MVTCLQCRYAFHNNAFNMTFKNETLTRGGPFQTNVNMSLKASTNKPLLGRSEMNRNETSSCCVPQYLYKTSHYRIFFFCPVGENCFWEGGWWGSFAIFITHCWNPLLITTYIEIKVVSTTVRSQHHAFHLYRLRFYI